MSFSIKVLAKPLQWSLTNNIGGFRSFHRYLAPTLRTLYGKKKKMGPQLPNRRSDFLEWNYTAEIYSFGKRLGEEFNEEYLREAFTDRSYIDSEVQKLFKVGIESNLDLKDNINLSLEGEKFMNQCVVEYLNTVLPRLPQKHISSLHDDLISDENLANISKHLGIDDLVLCAEFPPDTKTLSNTLKSVIQALILSSGTSRAEEFVKDFVLTQLCGKDITPFCTPENPIDTLKSIVGSTIESRLISETGRNAIFPTYQVGVYQNKEFLGKGCGETPWIAEEMAALDVIWKIWGISLNKKPFPMNSHKKHLTLK